MSLQIVPQTEVDGDSGERMDPRVMSFVTQISQLAQLTKLRKLEESKVPVKSLSETLTIVNELVYDVDPPWISFAFINDGPGALSVHVNGNTPSSPNEAPIPPGGRFSVDFTYPVIKTIYFQCATALPATIRLDAIVGKPNQKLD
jgi:hypothetical protein